MSIPNGDPLTCADDYPDGYVYDANLVVLWAPAVTGISGVSGVPFVALALNTFAPSITGIGAAIELHPGTYCLTEIVGWEVDTEVLVSYRWGPFASQRLGGQSVADAKLVFTADRAGQDIRQLLHRHDLGQILLLPSGPISVWPTSPLNVYPVRVAQLTHRQRLRDSASHGAAL